MAVLAWPNERSIVGFLVQLQLIPEVVKQIFSSGRAPLVWKNIKILRSCMWLLKKDSDKRCFFCRFSPCSQLSVI